jgi:hypothetical protein
MSNFIKKTKKRLSNMERGQVLVVVAVSIVAIIAIMGLALDVGMMFIENARLRRAVDSAALAAALQFREGYRMDQLDSSAKEFLTLNGIHDPSALVQVCNGPDFLHTIPRDRCPAAGQPPRKLVRVVATGTVHLAFLPVIGIDQVPIAAEAISETASVDVVLVLDRSDSMTYTAGIDDPNSMRDPSVCNVATNNPDPTYQGYCLPFDQVKKAAVSFVEDLYFPYDRVAVVTFDKTANGIPIDYDVLHNPIYFSNDPTKIISKIKSLTVFEGDETASGPLSGLPGINAIYPNGLPSRFYDPTSGKYLGLGCPQMDPALQAFYPDYPSPAPCTTTNIGGSLNFAGQEFNIDTPQNPKRPEALWVVILLTDGVANAGYSDNGVYFCPESTWIYTNVPPKCNNGYTKNNPANRHSPNTDPDYDAEDYAYDMSEFVAHDQSALLFTIGLGDQVQMESSVDHTRLGELFLRYASDYACNLGDRAKFCPGTYTFAPNGAALREVFRKIAENIATRLSH